MSFAASLARMVPCFGSGYDPTSAVFDTVSCISVGSFTSRGKRTGSGAGQNSFRALAGSLAVAGSFAITFSFASISANFSGVYGGCPHWPLSFIPQEKTFPPSVITTECAVPQEMSSGSSTSASAWITRGSYSSRGSSPSFNGGWPSRKFFPLPQLNRPFQEFLANG